ncbi:hypothetical protein SRHO_G00035070 [Serrasalmus rhombeus]
MSLEIHIFPDKAREEEASTQHSLSKDTPRLVLKTNSDALVCDWCKHIRHTKEYLDFGSGERRLQFCSAKCLNQYKMDIFYKETQAALPAGLCNPVHPAGEGKSEGSPGVQLLTPESWSAPLSELRARKAPSPGCATSGAGHSGSASGSPSEPGTMCSSSSSSSSAKIPTPRPHESPTLPASPSTAPCARTPPTTWGATRQPSHGDDTPWSSATSLLYGAPNDAANTSSIPSATWPQQPTPKSHDSWHWPTASSSSDPGSPIKPHAPTPSLTSHAPFLHPYPARQPTWYDAPSPGCSYAWAAFSSS